jgi:hypothetical protein
MPNKTPVYLSSGQVDETVCSSHTTSYAPEFDNSEILNRKVPKDAGSVEESNASKNRDPFLNSIVSQKELELKETKHMI